MKNLKLTKNDVIFETKYFIMLIILSFHRAFSNYVFVNSNGFAPGGVGGLAAIIYFAVTKSEKSPTHRTVHVPFRPGHFDDSDEYPLPYRRVFGAQQKACFQHFNRRACVFGLYVPSRQSGLPLLRRAGRLRADAHRGSCGRRFVGHRVRIDVPLQYEHGRHGHNRHDHLQAQSHRSRAILDSALRLYSGGVVGLHRTYRL